MFTDSESLSGYKPGRKCISIENGVFVIDTGMKTSSNVYKTLHGQLNAEHLTPFVHLVGIDLKHSDGTVLYNRSVMFLLEKIYDTCGQFFMNLAMDPTSPYYKTTCDYMLNENWNIAYVLSKRYGMPDTVVEITIGKLKNVH